MNSKMNHLVILVKDVFEIMTGSVQRQQRIRIEELADEQKHLWNAKINIQIINK